MTFIQANGKITSAATDSTGAKLITSDCPLCSIKGGETFDIKPECDMEEISVYAKRYEKSGALIICVEHIDGSFEHYRPKCCPECGRKLHD